MARSKGTRLPGQPDGPDWLVVTSPLLPEWDDLAPRLQAILERRWLTNQGADARELEAALVSFLGAPHALLMTNGTLALEVLVREAVPGGEVIVPAYSFPATWNMLFDDPRYTPVFVDIGADCNVDPVAVAAAVTPATTAVLGVHAYGAPCDRAALEAIAAKHGLALLFDAAHCAGVRVDGAGVGSWGDGSAWSFHATKVFNTLEGGAVTTADATLADRCRARRSFGQSPEGQVSFGTNAKMDEFRAAFGLATLPLVADAITARGAVTDRYDTALDELPIRRPTWLRPRPGFEPNHSYYPVFFEDTHDRDRAEAALREGAVLPRRYFGDDLFTAPAYAGRVDPGAVPNAARASDTVLCLPVHHRMTNDDVDHVVGLLRRAFS